jgi:spore coat protein A, manganese oxidase
MSGRITRRQALRLGLGGAAALALPAIGTGVASSFGVFDRVATVRRFELPLTIPPVLAPTRTDATTDYYEITQMQAGQEILPGLRTAIWGYNGSFPGPTIRARTNRRVVVRQMNGLPEPVSVHLHGGVQSPESDGYPTDLIPPGGTKDYEYANLHRAATLFYHDHAMDLTGPHIYKGLSGLYLLSDDVEASLPLPRGEFDVPLMIQDRTFNLDGSFAFRPNDPTNIFAHGGDVILVNGVPWPRFQVAARRYRFRIVNASSSRDYAIALSNKQPLIQIATDGGLLDRPLTTDAIRLGPAERAEVLVDFGGMALGAMIDLENQLDPGDLGALLRFEVSRHADEDGQVPAVLAPTNRLTQADAATTRHFVFRRTLTPAFPPFRWTINGATFDPSTIAARMPKDAIEIWQFENHAFGPFEEQAHPVHIHLVNFLVLDRNGRPPAPYETGWKDTVVVGSKETVRVIARFGPFTGKYVLHCHNLAHEDHAMMANFEVV